MVLPTVLGRTNAERGRPTRRRGERELFRLVKKQSGWKGKEEGAIFAEDSLRRWLLARCPKFFPPCSLSLSAHFSVPLGVLGWFREIARSGPGRPRNNVITLTWDPIEAKYFDMTVVEEMGYIHLFSPWLQMHIRTTKIE